MVEKNRLWTKVIRSRHGDFGESKEGAEAAGRRHRKSGWWGKITSLVEGNEGAWFWERVKLSLGDGSTVRFWNGAWAGIKR